MKRLFFIIFSCFTCTASLGQIQNTGKEWVQRAIDNRNVNDPEKKLTQYQYNSYNNLKISGDPEALTGSGYKKTELRKTLKQTGVFYSEKTSVYMLNRDKSEKEVITAINMSGFEKPVYPIYTINFQSRNIYDDRYIILDQQFINPVSRDGINLYQYSVVKDTVINSRATLKINVISDARNNDQLLTGSIYIDRETAAIARVEFLNTGTLSIEAHHDLVYDVSTNTWNTKYRDLFIKKEKTKKELELFGGRLEVGNEKARALRDPSDDLYVIMRTYNSDFKSDIDFEYDDRGAQIKVLEDSSNKPKKYWESYRNDDMLSNDDLASFMQLDSVITATNVSRKLETLDKFKVGYYPIGFFDIDLKYLVKFNDYEAFRLGIGGTTNEKFSDSWRVGGYLAYGTKDRTFKYKMSVGYRIYKTKNTWLSVYRQDDITEFAAESFLTDARVYSLFEPRLINIPTFYLFKEHGISLQQRPLANIIGEVSLSRKRVIQTTAYQFQSDGQFFDEYVLSEAAVGVRWSPKSNYMRTPRGYQNIKSGYPIFSGQVTKGFSNLVESNFDYFKASGKINYVINRNNKQNTDFTLEGHYATGDVPLTHLYHAYPNAPQKDEILQRFSVAGRRSFETMFFNEFFSERIAIAQVRHAFPSFNIASFLQPELVLISRFAIGDLDNKERHLNVAFDTLEHGYLESGFELNQLIFGFGLSASYRYGAYHLPSIGDNIALKFTFYLEL